MTSHTRFIGMYYELPDGRIARPYGWNGKEGMVLVAFSYGGRGEKTPESIFLTWKPRPDLKDFPDTDDPILPYSFDLFWGAKRRSELCNLLADPEDRLQVIEAMNYHGLEMNEAEKDAVAKSEGRHPSLP